ncbi:FAD/NAD(P)-binding protein [Streptomyces spongiicola]|uniref:FAD/NAD(P)-binding protein n=1 Tax=Streptomyces spongiicola TaxID=1690221 RepID=UPI0021D01306|nr:FAD/NAD(P)-binding protein [Streptomyces spongiicola]
MVGAGPRGLSVLERLLAQERKSPSASRLTVHVVDPHPPGPGRVWRTDQSRELLMNTVASQVTVFADASVNLVGPVEDGPSLHEWARDVAAGTIPVPGEGGADALEEARRLGPDDYPSRAFYGHYLDWVFRTLAADAPGHLEIRVHREVAVALDDESGVHGGRQTLLLADGTRLPGLDAVVLAQGHVPVRATAEEQRLGAFAAEHGLVYLRPANPADTDHSRIGPGESVVLRGLGLNFFDHMALLTTGRGGSFARVDDRLVYHPSGREPRILAGSRRGVPYHARGENEKGAYGRYLPRLLTVEKADGLRALAAEGEWIRFGTHLWPLITAEVESVYYAALLADRVDADELTAFTDRFLLAGDAAERDRLLDAAGVASAERWDWDRISRPYGEREFATAEDFRDWLLAYLRRDVAAAREGNVSGPLKAALDVLRDLRNEIRLAVDHGGLEANSHRDELERWYTPLNAFLSIGPPTSRIEELIALVEAGTVEIIGPGVVVETVVDDGGGAAFEVGSRRIPGQRHRAGALVESRLPEPDLRRTGDRLMRHLLTTGQYVPYRILGECGNEYETGAVSVSGRPYHPLDAEGRAHPRRFVHGVPTESVHWVTAAGIRPGVGSVTVEDSDAIAAAVLTLLADDARDRDRDRADADAAARDRADADADADADTRDGADAAARADADADADADTRDGADAAARDRADADALALADAGEAVA